MRVLFINSVIYGSTGRICQDLQHVLEKHGHESVICYARGKKTNSNFKFQNSFGVFFDGFSSRIFDNQGLNSKKQTHRLIKFICKYKPDIIHLHNIHGYFLNYELLFSFLRDKFFGSVIWTLHDGWPFTGHCTNFDFTNCDKWKTHCYKCEQKFAYPRAWFADHSYKNFEFKRNSFCGQNNLFIVTPSLWLSEQVGDSFLKDYPRFVINNGIDTTCFSKKEKNNRDIILFVAAQWTIRKGAHLIKYIVSGIDPSKKIVIVGKWKIKKPSIKNCTFIKKSLTKEELNDLYNSSCCFVNPTLDDNFPTVNIEAQCSGVPVVTFDSGGSRETIFLKESKVVPKNDIKSMKDSIAKIIAENKEESLSTPIDNFTRERMTENYLKLYEKVINHE